MPWPSLHLLVSIIHPCHLECNIKITGIAACNIGGVTIHSFGGIGLGTESAEDLATKIRKNKKASARWSRTKVLIIDEGMLASYDYARIYLRL